MANNQVNFVPQVDYTSRDYVSIREDLVNLIPTYAPNWTSRDASDFGITIVELFSYLGDLLNFYIDRAANEGFLATASQRDSVLQIATMLNYVPTTSSPSLADLTFTNTSATLATIPAGTQIATTTSVNGVSTQIIFETDEEVAVPAKVGTVNGTATVTATQGYTVANEVLGVSTGSPNQLFRLVEGPVIKDSIRVFVNDIEYSYSAALITNTIYDPVFTTIIDAEGSAFVLFGDGVGGRIPATAGTITATYRVGVGASGNVPANKITFFLTNAVSGVTVTNQEATAGGEDEESTDSIRTNAPLALRALNRAVSLKDYAYLALQVPGVAKAIADSEVYTSINLYIAPFGDPGASGSTTTAVFDELATRVGEFFIDKSAPNVTLTVLPPTYVDIDVDVTVNVLPQYRQDIINNQILASIRELFAAQNSFFADRIPVQYILTAINGVVGVDYAVVTYLRRASELQQFAISDWERTSNIVTITTTETHDITVGQTVQVSGLDADTDGSYAAIAVTGTTINFASVGLDVAPTALSTEGEVKALVVSTVECDTDEIPKEGTFNISVVGGIA